MKQTMDVSEAFRKLSKRSKWWSLNFNKTEAKLGGRNSNIFYVHPYPGKLPILTNIFFKWVVQPPTSNSHFFTRLLKQITRTFLFLMRDRAVASAVHVWTLQFVKPYEWQVKEKLWCFICQDHDAGEGVFFGCFTNVFEQFPCSYSIFLNKRVALPPKNKSECWMFRAYFFQHFTFFPAKWHVAKKDPRLTSRPSAKQQF